MEENCGDNQRYSQEHVLLMISDKEAFMVLVLEFTPLHAGGHLSYKWNMKW